LFGYIIPEIEKGAGRPPHHRYARVTVCVAVQSQLLFADADTPRGFTATC